MKRYLLPLLVITGILLPSAGLFAQHRSIGPSAAMRAPRTYAVPTEHGVPAGKTNVYHALANTPLPVSITIPGFSNLGVQSVSSSAAYQQSNGRSLHNIQVDPSNPLNVHALVTGMQNITADDTTGLFSRRLYYTFSSDGGQHWKAPVTLGDKRTGYGDLMLYNHGGKYVALVVGHTVTNVTASNAMVSVWLEKGNPGDGNFSQTVTNDQDIIWATGAVSKDNSTLYVIASRQAATVSSLDQLQFGSFTINGDAGTVTWKGWGQLPGDNDNNPDAGKTTGGEYRIHVGDDGRIGVAWRNDISSPAIDESIYFSESTDGGQTWSGTEMTQVAALSDPDDQGYQWWPTGSFDFWYEGNTPRFVWVQVPENFDANLYQPYNTTLMYWSPKEGGDPDTVATADPSGTRINPIPNSLAVISEPGSPQEQLIGFPTVARFDHNNFAVFYTGYQSGFWTAVDTGIDVQGPDTLVYSNIFYSVTHDGGKTWDPPEEFAVNSGTGQNYDFRFPSTSYFNPKNGTTGVAPVLVEIDSGAGIIVLNGNPIFDIEEFGVKNATIANLGVHTVAPTSLNVRQNYPNPFKPSTVIAFTLTQPSMVTVTVEDMMGRSVATVASGRYGAGDHSVTFNADGLSSGVYRYTLQANGETVSKTMTLLK